MTSPSRIVKLVLSLAYLIVRRTLAAVGVKFGQNRTVLTYHVVTEADIARFDWQMRQLVRYTIPVFADDPEGPRHSVAVTFDDAFEDVVCRVLPVLERYQVPVTIFVPTGYIGTTASWPSSSGKPIARRVASAEVIRGMNPRLARVGSHSVTHPHLAEAPLQQVRVELAESKATLEALTGIPVDTIALPYGSSNPDVIRVAQEVGYERVFANVPVFGRAAKPCQLVGRVDTSPQDWPLEFHLKLRGAYEWMAMAVPAKRQLLNTVRVSTAI